MNASGELAFDTTCMVGWWTYELQGHVTVPSTEYQDPPPDPTSDPDVLKNYPPPAISPLAQQERMILKLRTIELTHRHRLV